MKLLFDENISYRILKLLEGHFSKVESVFNLTGISKDVDIWFYAKENGLVIVTFDEDFYDWQILKGYPPKIIWLRMGNTSTKMLANKLIAEKGNISSLVEDDNLGILEIY
ncbi:MAG: DUF5615 family PIN-like protein [Bacteroidota bacterium]